MRHLITAILYDHPLPFWAIPLRGLLWWCSILYGAAVRIRRTGYETGILKSRQFPVEIVSVGNITVGGTGKTPFVIYLAQKYQAEGKTVVTISRGYKAESDTVIVVSDGQNRLKEWKTCGDEPYLIALKTSGIPVLACRHRAKACQFAIEQFNPDVIILDDAFQHWQVARDQDVVLVDAMCPFGNGHLLPRGILREPLSALNRASQIVLTRVSAPAEIHLKVDRPLLHTKHRPVRFRSALETIPLQAVQGLAVVAVSSIGNPQGFHHTLQELGGEIRQTLIFPDHHPYSTADVVRIRAVAQQVHAKAIITTEKDWVRLESLPHTNDFWVLEIELQILNTSE
ncbi:MAG: tetraacyldisaccharide 4'-kinase [Gemmatimonadetes bacterium]|nr:MAG: tetraacyldisaccharide 4'-kinase [Gemmatimonadota bacterium]